MLQHKSWIMSITKQLYLILHALYIKHTFIRIEDLIVTGNEMIHINDYGS